MDETTKPRPEGPVEKRDSNNDVALGIMFCVFGITLMTLDTPWVGLPFLAVGFFYLGRSMRDARGRRATPDETPDV